MNITVLTSSVLGPILLLLGIGLFINSKYYKNILEHVTDKSHTLIFVGIIGMILGAYMVSNNNILEGTPELIISIIGWAVLLDSSLILALPDSFTKWARSMKYEINTIKSIGLIFIVLGLYLLNFAYYGVAQGM
ncbi:MAG: hypothetical protein Q8K30_03495 [Candidatus Gracilibacteria bacterium]|nr:hypothetical protein [Candidatus Gracilibacteria bacterium]